MTDFPEYCNKCGGRLFVEFLPLDEIDAVCINGHRFLKTQPQLKFVGNAPERFGNYTEERDNEILTLIKSGMEQKQIAQKYGLSPSTVKTIKSKACIKNAE